jgi:AbrB family looped-hinge helix DNA binding protein
MQKELTCFGITKLGERGQLVIPIEVRKKWKLKNGDRFIVLGTRYKSLILVKTDRMSKMIDYLKKEISHLEKSLKIEKKEKIK